MKKGESKKKPSPILRPEYCLVFTLAFILIFGNPISLARHLHTVYSEDEPEKPTEPVPKGPSIAQAQLTKPMEEMYFPPIYPSLYLDNLPCIGTSSYCFKPTTTHTRACHTPRQQDLHALPLSYGHSSMASGESALLHTVFM